MKKNILLIITILLQFILIVLCCVPQLRLFVEGNIPFVLIIFNSYKEMASNFAKLIKLDQFLNTFTSRFINTISIIIVNLIYIAVYEIFAFIISLIIKKNHKKTLIANKVDAYTLTEEEKAKFNWKLYQKHFPFLGILTFIIPTFLMLFFVFLRFDKQICLQDNNNTGISLFYSNTLYPFINTFLPDLNKFLMEFINNYITLINGAMDIIKIAWLEYVILIVIAILVYLVWFLLVWVWVKLLKKHNSKKRAKKARKKYIAKMEKLELKARKKAGERISSKAIDLGVESNSQLNLYEDASIIAIGVDNTPKAFSNIKSAEYIDDIATGVVDLGVASTGDDADSDPIEKRIPIFVGDEDVDIILDNEPVIETIEEEKDEVIDEEEIFFEKYVPSKMEIDILDESLVSEQLEVIQENEKELEHEVIKVESFDIKKYNQSLEEEIFVDEILVEEKEYNSNLDLKINYIKEEAKKKIKKPSKPIDLTSKFNDENRFKKPKEKYLKIDFNNNKSKQSEDKKIHLIRRKKLRK